MKQTKKEAMFEAILNQVVGFTAVYLVQSLYIEWTGLEVSRSKHVSLMVLATIVSLIKHYAIRRFMENMKREK